MNTDTLTWINFLHLYQPPTQTKEVIDKIVVECYARIPELLEKHPKLKLTINIAGSLVKLFENYGYSDLLIKYKKYVEAGRIELVGSAMYHPLLALLPDSEIAHQIELNTAKLTKYFGDAYKPSGFFIPEMAYSKNVADVIKKMGFEWVIIDDICFPNGSPDNTKKYSIKDNGLFVLFRDRAFSRTFPPFFILDNYEKIKAKNVNTIIAHDGELYGHWHTDDKGFYEKAFTSPIITMNTVSEYLASLSNTQEIVPRQASWESLPEELEKNIPFALWNDPDNKIHKDLWAFVHFTTRTLEHNVTDKNYVWARLYLDQGLASCAWWWATGRKLVSTSPICWNPTEIEKGAQKLLTSIRSLQEISPDIKIQAEQIFGDLRSTIWKDHWGKYYK